MTNRLLTPCDDNLRLANPATQPENINVCLRCLSMHRIAQCGERLRCVARRR